MAVPNQTAPAADRWTPGATNYWEYYITPPASGDRMLVQVPKIITEGTPARIILYMHGRTGNETAINFGAMTAIRNTLLDEREYIIVSPYAHGDSWGNNTVMNDVQAAYDWVTAIWPKRTVHIMGGSMGANTAAVAYSRLNIPIDAVALFAPSISLEHVWSRGPGDAGRETLQDAYGIAENGSDLLTKTDGHDALRIPASQFANVHMRLWASPGDEVISYADSVEFTQKLQAVSGDVILTTTTGDHGSHDAYRPAEIMAFFNAVENPPPVPEPGPTAPQGVKAWDGNGWAPVTAIRAWNGAQWLNVSPTTY